MKLLKLNVKNWGPHKDVTVDLDAPIAGIVGSNGSGKSNLLQAIQFALTAILPANKNDVIRHGEKSATVSLAFEAHGKKGYIQREINTKTSKALLHWNGEDITKRGEILERIEELVGVDKEALDNAVFTEQGAVDKLVRGTPSERQTLFFKVLNLNFLAKRAERVGQEAKNMRADTTDLTPVRESILGAVAETEADMQSMQAALGKMEDPADKIKQLEQELKIRNDLDAAGVLIDSLNMHQRASESVFRQLLVFFGKDAEQPITQEVVNELLEAMQENQKSLQEDFVKYTQQLQSVKSLKQQQQLLTEYTLKKQSLKEQLERMITVKDFWAYHSFEEAAGLAETLREEKLLKDSYDSDKAALEAVEDKLAKLIEKLSNLSTKLTELDTNFVALQDKKQEKYVELMRVREHRAKAEWKKDSLDGYKYGEDSVCPLCGWQFHQPTKEQVEAAYQEFIDIDTECNKLSAAYNELLTQNENLVQERSSVRSELQYLLNDQRTCNADIKALRERVQKSKEAYQKVAAGNVVVDDIGVDYDTLQRFAVEYQRFKITDKEFDNIIEATTQKVVDMQKLVPKDISEEELQKECERYEFGLKVANNMLRENQPKCYKFIENTNRIASAQETLDRYIGADIRPEVVIRAELTEANGVMVERSNLIYAISVKETDLKNQQRKLEEVNHQIADYEEQLKTIRLLETAKDVLSRPNMPMAFASNIFSKMTVSVNDLLGQMGANFTVRPDPVEPISYLFKRLDVNDGTWMHQDRLSGGQAIRLSLAMLITMQRMLLPSIGLLILDEPSSHIDADGIENMADLFRSLTGTFEAARMQVVLVDHSETLVSACGKKFNLNKYLS